MIDRDDLMKNSEVNNKKKTTKVERKKEYTLSSMWIIPIAVAIFILLGGTNLFASNETAETNQMEPMSNIVSFCNNTHIIMTDKEGNTINGQVWYSQNGQTWEEGLPVKYQKGINYGIWIDSSAYFVSPVKFTPNCINENDTTIQYVRFEENSFKRGEPNIFLLDSYEYNIKEKEVNLTLSPSYPANLIIQIIPSPFQDKFMPFGGDIIIEYPNRITSLSCSEASILPPFSYTLQDVNNAVRAFSLKGDLSSSKEEINCQFGFSNPGSIPDINGKEYLITFIPADYYMSKTHELRLEITKERDEIYEYVSNSSIIRKGVFNVL